jgi:hypothetical protein
MIKSLEDVQKLNQAGLEQTMKVWGDFGKSFQSLAAEWNDYAKRSFEDGTQTFERLLTAKSAEQAFEIQTGYAKRAYENYVREVTKVGSLYQDLAKEAVKPMEKMFQPNLR